MRPLFAATLVAAPLTLAACASVPTRSSEMATARLTTASGGSAGMARFYDEGGSVTLRVMASGQTAGAKGLHLHTTGRCEGPGFDSAGGHLNTTGRKHGTLAANGPHQGDLPNITIAANGSGTLEADLGMTAAQAQSLLFDTDGTALVLHEAADDYRTDPSGNSGKRVACGVVSRV